jgi:hypothetical protein
MSDLKTESLAGTNKRQVYSEDKKATIIGMQINNTNTKPQ